MKYGGLCRDIAEWNSLVCAIQGITEEYILNSVIAK
jgi:hypothetical protein